MSVSLQQGLINSPYPLPSYAGQSFEWSDPGTVGRLDGEEHQGDSSLGGAMIAPPSYIYAGDDFETPVVLNSYHYVSAGQPYVLQGFFGAGQENSGGAALYLGFTVEAENPIPPIP